jgi:hypothetical protein
MYPDFAVGFITVHLNTWVCQTREYWAKSQPQLNLGSVEF